jgi:hypothetical protein
VENGTERSKRAALAIAVSYAARIALYLGGFSLIALLIAAQVYASAGAQGRRVDFGRIAAFQLLVWGVWAFFMPFIAGAVRRWPIRAEGIGGRVALHVALGCGVLVAKILVDMAVTGFLGPPRLPAPPEASPPPLGMPPHPPSMLRPLMDRPPWLLGALLMGLGPNLAAYVAIVGVCHAVDYYRKYRQRELDASRLEAQLAGARLQVLEMQLHPHFLFNTLNAIATLVRSDPDAAERMIASLGDLLRAVLRRSGAQLVPLAEEIELLERYLDIARMRYRDRLQVIVDVAPAANQVLVPTLIMQPLVENAVEHGFARRAGPGRIRIAAELCGCNLRLSVSDDGPGLAAEGPGTGGVGLRNSRERLQAI